MNNENDRKSFEVWAEPRGFMIESYQGPSGEWFFSDDDTQLDFECWMAATDAQRLRADTAEAESEASHQREARLQEMVSGLSDLLEEVLNEVPHGWGESFSDSELADRIRAALNQKSEGESQ